MSSKAFVRVKEYIPTMWWQFSKSKTYFKEVKVLGKGLCGLDFSAGACERIVEYIVKDENGKRFTVPYTDIYF